MKAYTKVLIGYSAVLAFLCIYPPWSEGGEILYSFFWKRPPIVAGAMSSVAQYAATPAYGILVCEIVFVTGMAAITLLLARARRPA